MQLPATYETIQQKQVADHATMGPQPDLARHQRFRRLVATGVKCISNYSELSLITNMATFFRYHVQFLRYKSLKLEL